jgi:hypothetical protein
MRKFVLKKAAAQLSEFGYSVQKYSKNQAAVPAFAAVLTSNKAAVPAIAAVPH